MNNSLIDLFGRVHTYLRISLTDRCNLRCNYCIPEHPAYFPHKKLLNAKEIEILTKYFVGMGINKIRLTGGEPLVRKDFPDIAERLYKLGVPIHLTTNGYLLEQNLEVIRKYFSSVNISLDTLRKDRFKQITKRDAFKTTLNNIKLSFSEGIKTKLNMVVIRGINNDEINDFVKLTLKRPVEIRFIEFMPFKGNEWSPDKLFLKKEIIQTIKREYPIEVLTSEKGKTATMYRIKNAAGKFGIISTVSNSFCEQCNRLRITADGKLKNCLLGPEEFDLKPLLHDELSFQNKIRSALRVKKRSHGIKELTCNYPLNICSVPLSMTSIGG
ncbi:MAG: GTP 3',8-cyclase MoaA [Bacteroidales bacterium]|nr:GTP 3',8-cyclase MoaA [Bacteroidales bacterium]